MSYLREEFEHVRALKGKLATHNERNALMTIDLHWSKTESRTFTYRAMVPQSGYLVHVSGWPCKIKAGPIILHDDPNQSLLKRDIDALLRDDPLKLWVGEELIISYSCEQEATMYATIRYQILT